MHFWTLIWCGLFTYYVSKGKDSCVLRQLIKTIWRQANICLNVNVSTNKNIELQIIQSQLAMQGEHTKLDIYLSISRSQLLKLRISITKCSLFIYHHFWIQIFLNLCWSKDSLPIEKSSIWIENNFSSKDPKSWKKKKIKIT